MITERGDSHESKTTAFESVPMAPPTACNKQASELSWPAAVTPSSKATQSYISS